MIARNGTTAVRAARDLVCTCMFSFRRYHMITQSIFAYYYLMRLFFMMHHSSNNQSMSLIAAVVKLASSAGMSNTEYSRVPSIVRSL